MQFDELAEIYTSMSLRSLGFSIVGIFIPIYLYERGVELQSIFWLFSWIFLLRIPVAFVAAYVVGRAGPKHSIALSTLLFILFLVMLLSFTTFNWPLVSLAALFTISNGLFFIAYNTDFSKIKHSKHGGKELGWLYIFERIGGALGPFIGGLLASLARPEVTIVAAIAVLLGSLVPLFLTNEPVRLHQHITFRGFPWRRHVWDAVSLGAFNMDNISSLIWWPLFVAVTVFITGTYAKLGAVVALAMGISIFSAYMFGKFIDGKRGRALLFYGVITNASLHILRPFISTPAGVVAVSTANEPVTLSYRLPLFKAFYDAGDSEEGYRIVYMALTEMIGAFCKAVLCFSLYFAAYWAEAVTVLQWHFVVVGCISLGILLQRFPALKKA